MATPDLRSVVESILFVSDEPIALDKLCAILEEYDRQAVRQAVYELRDFYEREQRGIVLDEVAGGVQLRSRPEHAGFIRRLNRVKPFKFSQSALETLAIIAYKQPITRAEIEHLRGVDGGGVIKTLLDKKLIRILGKKDIPGKPLIYGTTREFLEIFSLHDLSSLPTLKEIQELSETGKFEQQEELPLFSGEGPTAESEEAD